MTNASLLLNGGQRLRVGVSVRVTVTRPGSDGRRDWLGALLDRVKLNLNSKSEDYDGMVTVNSNNSRCQLSIMPKSFKLPDPGLQRSAGHVAIFPSQTAFRQVQATGPSVSA